ncbi:3-oxoacyl-ACP reductase [Devosia sp. Root685]|uniref:SDR family NAD(P)-dependent oxidoreductase n=1 Tax=Devosia sp. Root685 TaxID=1736587 RepID=UPI0006FB9AD7|nr:SDR family oxidoreductase [Devosia sp. Root685]KRA99825.1 3-oxoacyl-ACP reductase [Devosia sp. Root685]
MAFAVYPSLAGRTVIVTGGASGIGAAIVENLARSGSTVAFIDVAVSEGQTLVESVVGKGYPRPVFINCDLLDLDATKAAIERVAVELGPIKGLVNNAANDLRRPMEETGPAEFEWAINVNLRHVYFCTKAVLPYLEASGGGSVVNMSSLAWVKGTLDLQAYSAAKAGIIGLTSSLAHKVGQHNIRVNVITPGAVMTEKQKRLWFDRRSQETVLNAQCIRETVVPDDIARMVLFLLADDSQHITKQNFAVDGGR